MDLTETVTAAFPVFAVELDEGTLFLAARSLFLGRDHVVAAVLGGVSVGEERTSEIRIERQALPEEFRDSWWRNRDAAILEVRPGAGSVYDGRLVWDGVISTEPDEEAGVLTLHVGPRQRRAIVLPGLGLVTAAAWPLAADAAMGQALPMIFGQIEDCPLLPVRLPAATALAADANPGDGQLDVEDAAALPASGSVWVDGHAYTYEAKSAAGNTLLGVTVASVHRQGTACVAAGDTVALAAGHACAAIADLRANARPIAGGVADLAAGTVTFSAPPLQVTRSERFTLTAQFDQVGAGSTALNAINAIRAVTGTATQSASTLPAGVTAASQNVGIAFPRPVGGRIIKGVYTVAFAVTVGSQVGWARLKIGNEVVWMFEPPASVIYNWSPASILFDADVDFLPVSVEVAEGGSTDQVSVTLTSASRSIALGNLDDANYATLTATTNALWRADQTDALPDRGPIARARLAVRWFAADGVLGSAQVKFGGHALGSLAQSQLAAQSVSQTVSVDVINQGAAGLPQQAISTYVSGGTAALSHSSVAMQASVTVPILKDLGAGVYRGFSPCPSFDGWDASLGSIVFRIMITGTSVSEAENKYFSGAFVEFLNSSGSAVSSGIGAGSTETVVSGQLYAIVRTLSWAPTSLRFVSFGYTGLTFPMQSVAIAWNGRITANAAALSNTPASGSSNPIPEQSLGNSGIAVRTNNGAINIVVPAPPRVTDTLFDLPWCRSWSDFTGAQAEITYAGANTADLCLVQTALLIEYDAQVLTRADEISATVTGLSGNPADVISALAAAVGERMDPAPTARLRAWCTGAGYGFARRLSQSVDALQMLTFAAEQAHVLLARRNDALAPVRWLDTAGEIYTIRDADLIGTAKLGWAERVETDLTLRYREDYRSASAVRSGGANGAFARVLTADSSSNAWCRRGEAMLHERRPVEIEGGFLRTDTAAARYLSDYARRNARPRRVLTLPLPFGCDIGEGDLIEYLPPGASSGEGVPARVTARLEESGWISLTAEELRE